jgi:serine/threonine protein kinase
MKKALRTVEKDLYGILEVSPTARPEVLKAAHKTLMTAHHPDRNGGKEEPAKTIGEAFAILINPDERAKYDQQLRERANGPGIVGNYQVLELIAEGGFGKTYKAKHLITDELVCLKHAFKISAQSAQILIEETKAMWDLRHYAIPAVRDLIKLGDGKLVLVMSYIPGLTLEQIVEKVGRVDAKHVGWIAERAINALMYMHYNGVIHGDIKPQNIIVQETHAISLIDFGLAMVEPGEKSNCKGYTECFAPPEQIKGRTLLPESDFYSLAMTLIYALGGGIEYVEKKMVPKDVPDEMCQFIKRLIARDILSRPNWTKENLFETIQRVRIQSFGKHHMGMEPIPGL